MHLLEHEQCNQAFALSQITFSAGLRSLAGITCKLCCPNNHAGEDDDGALTAASRRHTVTVVTMVHLVQNLG